jgi:hypothetical protein
MFLGVFFALELILNFTIFGVLGDLQHQGSWTDFSTGLGYTVASLAGLSACLALTAARPRDDNADKLEQHRRRPGGSPTYRAGGAARPQAAASRPPPASHSARPASACRPGCQGLRRYTP